MSGEQWAGSDWPVWVEWESGNPDRATVRMYEKAQCDETCHMPRRAGTLRRRAAGPLHRTRLHGGEQTHGVDTIAHYSARSMK